MSCLCVWEELPNQSGSVKGSVLKTECEECRGKREQANAARVIADQKAKEDKEVEDLIQGKIREFAISELKKEGKLDENGKAVKGEPK